MDIIIEAKANERQTSLQELERGYYYYRMRQSSTNDYAIPLTFEDWLLAGKPNI